MIIEIHKYFYDVKENIAKQETTFNKIEVTAYYIATWMWKSTVTLIVLLFAFFMLLFIATLVYQYPVSFIISFTFGILFMLGERGKRLL